MRVMRELVQVGARADAVIADVARRFGVSHAALNALAVIEAADGPVATGEVTSAMHIRTATMTRILDTLQSKGLITREPDPRDRRRVLLTITPDAQNLLDQLLPAVQQQVTATFSAVPDPKLWALLDSLGIAAEALAAAPQDPLPPAPPRVRRAPQDRT